MQPYIPVPILQNIKCGHCRKYVSCGPIFVTPNSSVICGRCTKFAIEAYRNYSFEALGSLYRYPCHYWSKHCNKKLQWDEALDHENDCLFQSSCNVFCSRPATFCKSDRKLPNNTEISLEHVTDDILKILKCVLCESYLSNLPVYLLPDGKNICHRCSHSNGTPKEAVRNLVYEALASYIIFPCIYRNRGCPIWMRFGRDMWGHEDECSYGQIYKKLTKKPSKVDGKERGVIETHSGHYWGTITPHSAPAFAPPKTKNNDGKILTQELTEVIKKKQEENRNFDSASIDSIMSGYTADSLMADNISRDNVSRSTIDNISRSTVDNISRDNVSRHTLDNVSRHTADNVSRDNVSRDNVSRASSRIQPRFSNDSNLEQNKAPAYDPTGLSYYEQQKPRPLSDEVVPQPTPVGYNKIPFNGYYQENVSRFGNMPHIEYASPLNYSGSFNYGHIPAQIPPKRSESFRVGNQSIIDEIKMRNMKKNATSTQENA